jgi:1,4-dihydroxy-2-naphthoyl-CoA hydrolase
MSNISDSQSRDITAEVQSIGMGALGERMGITLVSASIDSEGLATISATMPVEGNTQPYGLLHGGASAVLAETLGSIASGITAFNRIGEGTLVVGIDLNCTHHKAARDGVVTGVAQMISAGNTMLSSEIVITNAEGERICTSRLTAMARKPRP